MIIKNSNLRRDLFSNRYKILAIIVAIILTLCLIQLLNEMAKQANKKPNNKANNTVQDTYKPQETVIQGGDVSTKEQEINSNIMDDFIKYCNSKDIEKAYNLLTDECKELLFNSDITKFKHDYVEKIFTTKKTYSMQSWINSSEDTYKVKIMGDILSTGKVEEAIEEYYTIVKQDGEYKLNLNSYIGRKTINKAQTINNITITVISKDIYMDYEIYNIKVENNSDKTIILDTKRNTKSAYVTGNNGTTYSAFMYELSDVQLTIKPRIYRKLSVRVNKVYNAKIKENKISFTDIVTDAESYIQAVNQKDYKETIKNGNRTIKSFKEIKIVAEKR